VICGLSRKVVKKPLNKLTSSVNPFKAVAKFDMCVKNIESM
jgi:hypothetical protein